MQPEQLLLANWVLIAVNGFTLVGGVLIQDRDARRRARQRDAELALLNKQHDTLAGLRKPLAPVGLGLKPAPGKRGPAPKGVRIVIAAPKEVARGHAGQAAAHG